MLFDEEFLEAIENDPITGVIDAINLCRGILDIEGDPQGWSEREHTVLWETFGLVEQVLINNEIMVDGLVPPVPSGSIFNNCSAVSSYLDKVYEALAAESVVRKVEVYRSRYSVALRKTFAYEFSQGDLDRIQELVNEIREQLTTTTDLEDNHKQRLLRRLEKLQSELHKRMSDLDRFYGMVGDAGIVLGKLGNDAKPIVDRIREIAEIVWKTQARAEELPGSAQNPMLENISEE